MKACKLMALMPSQTGSAFLQPQPLDKNTPPTRSWKKVKREIIGPSGIPFTVSIWQGGEVAISLSQSKRALANALA